MADPAALRQKRYRLHSRGDHSLCVLGRCPDVTPPVTRNTGPDLGEQGDHRLGRAGAALWSEMNAGALLGPMQRVLLLEACRLTDRLDKLDAVLAGEVHTWLTLELREDDEEEFGRTFVVVVNSAVAEARQTAVALKSVMSEIRMAGRTGGAAKTPPAGPGTGPMSARKAAAAAGGERPVAPVAQLSDWSRRPDPAED